jgi:hypothetical protein
MNFIRNGVLRVTRVVTIATGGEKLAITAAAAAALHEDVKSYAL